VYEGGATVAALIKAENPSVTTPQPGNIYVIAGQEGVGGTPTSGTLATSATFTLSSALSIDAAGDVYFTGATADNVVWVLYAGGTGTAGANLISLEAGVTSPKLGYFYAIAGNSNLSTYTGDGSLATSSGVGLYGIGDVALDAAGDLYIVDNGHNAIREVNAKTGMITTVAGGASGAGTAGSTGVGGPATAALLNAPYGVAIDASGDFYIADKTNHEIKMVYEGGAQAAALLNTLSIASPVVGDIYIVVGGGKSVYPYNALATSCVLSSPTMVALDAANNIYITDNGFDTVMQVNAITGIMTAVAGTNGAGYSGDGGPALSAAMTGIRAAAVDTAGRLYITDATNARIREVSQGVLIFVGEPVGDTSAPKAMTLVNTGNAALNFTGGAPVFGGTNPGDFAIDTASSLNTCNQTSLAPGASCAVAITYSPTGSGIRTATLSYTTNGVLATQQITLEGLLTPTTTGLAASTMSTYPGQNVVLTVTTSATAGTPTGTVTFSQGTTVLETVPLPASGIVSYTVGPLALGAYSYSVTYSGDNAFATSTSNTVTVNVDSFSISSNTTTVSVIPGQATQAILTITGQGPATQLVAISCSGPSTLGCSFSPAIANVPAGGSLAVTISVGAVATTSKLDTGSSNYSLALLPLGALLLFGIRKRKLVTMGILAAVLCLLPLGLLSGCSANNEGSPLAASSQSVVVTVTGTNGDTLSQTVTLGVAIQ
jgi:hypothetical protein